MCKPLYVMKTAFMSFDIVFDDVYKYNVHIIRCEIRMLMPVAHFHPVSHCCVSYTDTHKSNTKKSTHMRVRIHSRIAMHVQIHAHQPHAHTTTVSVSLLSFNVTIFMVCMRILSSLFCLVRVFFPHRNYNSWIKHQRR